MKFYRVRFLKHELFFDNKESAKKFFEKMLDNGCEISNFEFATSPGIIAKLVDEREENGASKTFFLLEHNA